MFNLYLLSILRIQCAKYDCVDIVVPPEKEPEQTQQGVCSEKKKKKLRVCVYDVKFHSLPLVVGEGDSLGGHFEVDYGRGRGRVGAQSHGGGFLHRLDAGE